MSHDCLADFLEHLDARGELARIETESDCDLQIAHATGHVVKQRGRALLFSKVRDREMAVVTNLFGSLSRVLAALGAESVEAFVDRATGTNGRTSWLDRLRSSGNDSPEKLRPKQVKLARCQQVVRLGSDVDLHALPALRSWPSEERASITSGMIISYDAETQQRTLDSGILPIVDRDRLAVVVDPLSPLLQRSPSSNEKMPVAVILGGPPPLMLAAQLPRPEGDDPFAVVGRWMERALTVAPGRSQDIEIPAEAELVIEGYIDPTAPLAEIGNVAAPSGFYIPRQAVPVIQVTSITSRSNAGMPATVFSQPPSERSALSPVIEQMVLAQLAPVIDVADLALPECAGTETLAVVAISKRFAHQARQVAGAIWGHPALLRVGKLIIVDSDLDIRNLSEVMFRVSANLRPEIDIFTQDGPAGRFDHAATTRPQKLGFDATAKLPAEGATDWPNLLLPDAEAAAKAVEILRHLGEVQTVR